MAACGSGPEKRIAELHEVIDESGKLYGDEYAEFLSDDFVWDQASSPLTLGRSDFVAAFMQVPEGDDDQYHFQERILAGGDSAFFDGCSFVEKDPNTGVQSRLYHADLLDYDGLLLTRMTTYSDGALRSINAGLIEPTLPMPPLPINRPYPTPEPVPTNASPLDVHATVHQRWNEHDLDAFVQLLADGSEMLISPMYDPVNRGAFVGWLGVMFKAFPDLTIEATRTVGMEDDWIVSESLMQGTNLGEYMGNAPTRKPISLRIAILAHYNQEGLATELRLYLSSVEILDQLGLEPTPVGQAQGA